MAYICGLIAIVKVEAVYSDLRMDARVGDNMEESWGQRCGCAKGGSEGYNQRATFVVGVSASPKRPGCTCRGWTSFFDAQPKSSLDK
jgi:hypothetical protein